MVRVCVLVLAAIGFVAGVAAAADSPLVGKWDLIATDINGQATTWTLAVTEQGGKLAGSLIGPEVTFELVEPKLEGNNFSFKIMLNEQPYRMETKIDGDKLEGTFKGPEASGTVKATRQK